MSMMSKMMMMRCRTAKHTDSCKVHVQKTRNNTLSSYCNNNNIIIMHMLSEDFFLHSLTLSLHTAISLKNNHIIIKLIHIYPLFKTNKVKCVVICYNYNVCSHTLLSERFILQ